MASQPRLDPELRARVDRAREQARQRGELRDSAWMPPRDPRPVEARSALKDWVASGDCERAVAEIGADDPDLASQ